MWPTAVDYRDALQHPARVFSLPELKSCRVETNHLGVPRPRSGASAQVYKFFHPFGTRAVRLFLYPNDQRETRYRALHDHLASVKSPSLVNFQYHPQGIQIGNGRFPVLTMDWVDGISLGEWVRQKVRQDDLSALRRLADRWVILMRELQAAQIAHGDLQHDNVMVVGEQLKLVDYDGMCVPRLVGADALECGKPGYQHPRRVSEKLSLELDHFSAWVILIALRGIVAQPRLWQEYVEKSNNENLLFTENDHFWPQKSTVWRELMASPDNEVRSWATRVFATLPNQHFDSIPRFDFDPFADLRRLCSTLPRDWRSITRVVLPPQPPIPKDLIPILEEARRREHSRRELEDALKSGDGKRVATVYRPECVDDWPDCAGLVLKARQLIDVQRAIDEMRQALQGAVESRELQQLWTRHAARLLGTPEGKAIRQEVERRKERESVWEEMRETIRLDNDTRIVTVWKRMQQVGGPPLSPDIKDRVDQALARSESLGRVKAIRDDLPEDEQDRLLLEAWDDAILRTCSEAAPWRSRWETARERVKVWKELHSLLQSQDLSRIEEVAAHPLLVGYPPFVREQARIRELIERGPRVRRVMERLEVGDCNTFETEEARQTVQDGRTLFEPFRQRMALPLHVWELGSARLTPLQTPLQILDGGKALRVRWSWSRVKNVPRCLLAVGERFYSLPVEARHLIRIEEADHRRGLGGFLLPISGLADEAHVTIWPVMDLVWLEIAGMPLHLGPLVLRNKQTQREQVH